MTLILPIRNDTVSLLTSCSKNRQILRNSERVNREQMLCGGLTPASSTCEHCPEETLLSSTVSSASARCVKYSEPSQSSGRQK